MQVDAGAAGITVAKLGEAEVMADAGFDDLLVAYPIVGEAKLARLRALRERARVRVSLDSVAVASGIGSVGSAADPVEVLIEVDTGHHRMGRPPGEPHGAARRRGRAGRPASRWSACSPTRATRTGADAGRPGAGRPRARPTTSPRPPRHCARAGIEIRRDQRRLDADGRRGGRCRRRHGDPPRHVRVQRRPADAARRGDRGRLRRTRPGDRGVASVGGPVRDRRRVEEPLVRRAATDRRSPGAAWSPGGRTSCWTS